MLISFTLIRSLVFITIKIRSFLQATIKKKKKRFQVEGDFSLKEKNQEKIQGSDQEFCEGKLHVGTFLHL